jgi:hypothetical protein
VRALTVQPGVAGSATMTDVPAPPVEDGPVVVDKVVLEIAAG